MNDVNVISLAKKNYVIYIYLVMYKTDVGCKLSTLKGWKYLDDTPLT